MSQRGADIVLYTEVGGVRCNLDDKAFPSHPESTPVMPGPLTKLMPGTIVHLFEDEMHPTAWDARCWLEDSTDRTACSRCISEAERYVVKRAAEPSSM